jgi:hypothetical protein
LNLVAVPIHKLVIAIPENGRRSSMKNSMRFFVGISLLVLAAFCSCGIQNAETEMKAAQAAMEKAKSYFAEDLAPADWKEAMTSWEQGQAALQGGKPAKTYFLRAKSRFEKTALIAKANGENMAKEVASMQISIGERFSKIRSVLDQGKVPARVEKQVKPLAAEVEEGTASVDSLVSQGNYLKALMLARDVQTKVYQAELLVAGKKLPQ